jgi:hypothetical protein
MTDLPPNAVLYLPVLVGEVRRDWADHPLPSTLAAQVEQETCISIKHKGCWNPKTELKTSREYGFGLGQITITARMNVFNEVKTLDPTLKNWKFEDRYDPAMQLRALVLKDKQAWQSLKGSSSVLDHLAFTYAAYNGGLGGVSSDRRMCSGTQGCNTGVWFGNVEHTSLKNRGVVGGYGQSFFAINREYVVNVLINRRKKYDPTFKE